MHYNEYNIDNNYVGFAFFETWTTFRSQQKQAFSYIAMMGSKGKCHNLTKLCNYEIIKTIQCDHHHLHIVPDLLFSNTTNSFHLFVC